MIWKTDKQKMRRTLEDRWVRRFLQKSAVVRWLIVIGTFAGLISLVVSSGRVEPLDMTLGQISPRTIVALVDFAYPDEIATTMERTSKAALAPNVYRLSLDEFQRELRRVQHLMDRVVSLKQSGKISDLKSQKIADIWNEGGGISLSPGEVQSLLYLSDKKVFMDALSFSGQKLARNGMIGDDWFLNPETTLEYAPNPADLSQLKTAHASKFPSVQQARRQLLEELNASIPIPKASGKVVEKLVADILAPNLQLDLGLSARLQEQQRQSVKTIYRNISKGHVMIHRDALFSEDKLAMFKAHHAELERNFSSESRWRQRVANGLLVVLIVGTAILILAFQHIPGYPVSNREYGLLATLIVLHFGLNRLVLYGAEVYGTFSPSLSPSLMPGCFGPMLIGILIHRRFAHLSAFVCSFLLGILTHLNFAVMLTFLVSSVVGIHFSSSLRRRSRIYEAGLAAGLSAALVNMVFGFMWDVPWQVMGMQGAASVGAAMAASVVIGAFLPIFESLFKVTTDLRWLEMSDLNHPLLRRMVMEAPGTYHHSLVVANLAERACQEIGAHALQARVCSYFHDIGKVNNPDYFCENQSNDQNPHDDIAPNMSALIIIAHVKDGVDIALQHHLARPIIDTIHQHHGTSRIAYFYRLATRREEDAKLGSKIMHLNVSDVPRVQEETYRYPGPKPSTREIGVISLADAVEGASRSMLKPTPQKIEALIAEIIEERLHDGQLDDSPLSLRELRMVAESFSRTLLSMLHTRISYPKDEADVHQSASLPSAATS